MEINITFHNMYVTWLTRECKDDSGSATFQVDQKEPWVYYVLRSPFHTAPREETRSLQSLVWSSAHSLVSNCLQALSHDSLLLLQTALRAAVRTRDRMRREKWAEPRTKKPLFLTEPSRSLWRENTPVTSHVLGLFLAFRNTGCPKYCQVGAHYEKNCYFLRLKMNTFWKKYLSKIGEWLKCAWIK